MDDLTTDIRRIADLKAELAKPVTPFSIFVRTVLYIPQLAALRDRVARQEEEAARTSQMI